MSITLGGNIYETKKTVGQIPSFADDIIAIPPCDTLVNMALLQPKLKKIHEYQIIYTNISGPGLYNIPDDVFADGYDYEVTFGFTILGVGVTTILQQYSYTLGGNNWFHNVDNIVNTVTMNESNCAGSYSNNSVGLNLNYASASPFSVQINMVIRQLIPATLEVNVCGGGGFNHTTALERIVEDIQVYDGEVLDPIPETVPSYKRNKTYNPSPLTPYGQSQLANLPKTCINFKVYYIGSLFSSVYSGVAKTYFLDSGAYEIKINIPISPPAIRGYRLNDGFNDYFTGVSDIDGIMNWTPIDMSAPAATFNMELHVYDGLTQVFNSDAQFVFLKYDLTTNACPCACPVNCGDITVIFNQSCGGDVALKLNLQIQQGNYSIEGDSFTQGDSIIRPITKTKATYELVISEYSDEVYLALMDLIGNNEYIEVVDNIDPLNPETVYYVDLERLDPNWNFNSKLGSMVIPVIKKDSIKTFRRNCCD